MAAETQFTEEVRSKPGWHKHSCEINFSVDFVKVL